MSEGRVYFGLCQINDDVLIIGGYDGEKILKSCEIFRTET